MFFLGCRDCCKEPSPIDCTLGRVMQHVGRQWISEHPMDSFNRVCENAPLDKGPLRYDFFYAPTKNRLSPPDGRPGHISQGNANKCYPFANEYFVNDRPSSRFVQERSFQCIPFRIVPNPTNGEGLEEPASEWDCHARLSGDVAGFSSSEAYSSRIDNTTGHHRQGTRWPEWQWELKADAPNISMWDFIAGCVGFVPSRITVFMTVNWRFHVELHRGHINGYGALWGTDDPKMDVTTNWEAAIKVAIHPKDEPAARGMLAGDIGGRSLWSRSVAQTIPGGAEIGSNGPTTPQWNGLTDAGSRSNLEFDLSTELQAANLSDSTLWLGPQFSPPFGEETVRLATATFFPPVFNVVTTLQYAVGYVRGGYFSAAFKELYGMVPSGAVLFENFVVYR